MKKIFLTLVVLFAVVAGVTAQDTKRFSFATAIGTGIPMSTPSSTPFEWQILGYYNFNQRFSAGIGTGISVYEKAVIPLFADVKFNITKPRKFTPYLDCGAGYSFAPDKNANGGIYVNPAVGVQWSVCTKMKLLFAVGYEMQKYERLKSYNSQYFDAEFKEQLNHNSISIKIGVMF